MRIHEILEENFELAKDGYGNLVVYDPHRRIEVLVPEKEAAKLAARNQLIGGALNISGPSRYSEAPGSIHNKKQQAVPMSEPKTALGKFTQGFKKGFNQTNKAIRDIEYSPIGQAATGISQFAKQSLKNPAR